MKQETTGLDFFFATWRFPALMLSLLIFLMIFNLVTLLVPATSGALGEFISEYKYWCFGYDSDTGALQWNYVFMYFYGPTFVSILIYVFWGKSLKRELAVRPRAALPYSGAALACILIFAASLVFGGEKQQLTLATTNEPFPAQRMRTQFPAPEFALTNHVGQPVNSADLRGRINVFTGFYATCGLTCPLILNELKRLPQQLTPEELKDVNVVAVSLNPANDTVTVLAKTAEVYGVQPPLYNLTTGDPAQVNTLLDRLNISRRMDHSGLIDHTNVFMVTDRDFRIAYTITLGLAQKGWLAEALKTVINERRN